MDKVYCPYCGNQMTQVIESLAHRYWCTNCYSQSPTGLTAEEAYAAAIRRPLQKPLTIEGVKTQIAVWVEEKTNGSQPVLAEIIDTFTSTFSYDGLVCHMSFYTADYGKTWRCWAMKPTEEERSAAKWE